MSSLFLPREASEVEQSFVRPPKGVQEFTGGCELSGQNAVRREKHFSELGGVYKQPEGLKEHDPNGIAYWVVNQNYHRQDFVMGNLQWGTTYINPFTVRGECAMTHGHYHIDPNCDEYYYGLSGSGFLLFWDGGDDFYAEQVFPGSLHYISGRYAHRIINSGDSVLAVAACSLPATKQDHARIEREPFPWRCFKRDGEIVWEKEGA